MSATQTGGEAFMNRQRGREAEKGGGMTPIESYAGMEVYTNDDKRVGRVEQTHGDGGAEASECVTIDRPRARDIAVPRSILRVSGDHLVLPFGMTVVESAPNVSPRRRTMTIEEKWILDSFYSLWTGVPVTKVEIVKGQSIKDLGEGEADFVRRWNPSSSTAARDEVHHSFISGD
jgi:hypothetical protein